MAERTCAIDGCDRAYYSKSYCRNHYDRMMRLGHPLAVAVRKPKPRRTCTVDDCSTEHYANGLCENHYARQRRHGGLHDKRSARSDPMARLMSRVVKTDTCWLWQGPPNSSGYGTFNIGHGTVGVHAAMLLLEGREIPDGMEVDHLCRVRLCVRPDHLEVVTGQVNNARSTSVSAVNAAKTRCDSGHEFTPENTRLTKLGRHCKACHRERERAAYHRRKANRAS